MQIGQDTSNGDRVCDVRLARFSDNAILGGIGIAIAIPYLFDNSRF